MTPQEIEVLIRAHLPDTTATVQSTDNVHFEAVVVSPSFLWIIKDIRKALNSSPGVVM